MIAFTPHPDVNALLAQLLDDARAILGDQFVGLYLYGSLSSGDFNPATSDIDFVVVTAGPLPPSAVAALEALHARPWAEGSHWAAHLEGAYIPRVALRRYDPATPPVPQVNEGRFRAAVAGHGSDWVIQRHVIRDNGLVLAGPPPAALIDPVSPEDLRSAVAAVLHVFWASAASDPAFLRRPDYQAFAVLTMCRALYALQNGAIVSKPAAARWALATLPRRWHPLIRQAVAWRPGTEIERADEIQEFIRYTVDGASA